MSKLQAAVLCATAVLALAQLSHAQEQEAAGEELSQLVTETAMPVVKFESASDIGLLARIHFATHTTNFQRARQFYRTLGYTQGVDDFPLTNTHQMARALGMFDVCQYELSDGEVMQLPGSPNPASIDLLQFKTPFDDSPPYEKPNHLGMAYAAFATSDFDSDVETLKAIGSPLLSEPFGQQGERFVFFRDPDGVLYKLLEVADGPESSGPMHIFNMPYVAVNVSNLEASLEFYAQFGYTEVNRMAKTTGSLAEARAYGLDGAFTLQRADIRIARGDGHTLRLTQWLQPFDPEPAYPPPINRIGINRIALLVPDLDRAVSILKSQGVPFLSELAPCCTGTEHDATAIVHAIDPDGAFLELVGGIKPRPVQPQPESCPPLTIKRRAPLSNESDASSEG